MEGEGAVRIKRESLNAFRTRAAAKARRDCREPKGEAKTMMISIIQFK